MKPYRDVFGNNLPKRDIELAVRTIYAAKKATSSLLQRRLGWGYGKVMRVYELLEDAGIVGLQRSDTTRQVIYPNVDTAINMALRQLKKGKK